METVAFFFSDGIRGFAVSLERPDESRAREDTGPCKVHVNYFGKRSQKTHFEGINIVLQCK